MSSAIAAMPHLLRPWWLLALLALPWLWALWRRRERTDTPWARAVDPHLLPNLLQAAQGTRGSTAPWWFAACYAMAVLALAGPAWRGPAATYAPQAPLVVVEDMSSHMLVADLVPSRMLRARLKVQQLIAQRKGGQIGLVAYAGDAFTVAPLSDDAHSLDDLVVALSPDTMPVEGQRADRALHRAAALLSQAGFHQGTVLLLTDTADAAAIQAARDLRAKGYEVDVLGVGTASGAPLPANDGSFAQAGNGGLQIARLDPDALRRLADAGGGRYVELTSSGDDLAALGVLDPAAVSAPGRSAEDRQAWRDGGPYLLLALVPLAAFGFRRGWLAVVLLAMVSMPAARVEAKQPDGWDSLWQRADQRADHALRAGDVEAANALAQTAGQRAAVAYRKGDYAAAADGWSRLDTADANYNRGNALAQMQRYEQAIDAWQRALRQQPSMADAQANIGIVKQLLRKQAQQKNSQQQGKQHQPSQSPQRQDSQQRNPQGQSQNQENMQHDQQQAQQQGGPPTPGQQRQDPRQQAQAQPSDERQGASQREDASQPSDASGQPAPDRTKQAQADAAERLALQKAMKDQAKADGERHDARLVRESTAQSERHEANEILMRRVPDEPGSLLKRKFRLEYERRQQEGNP